MADTDTRLNLFGGATDALTREAQQVLDRVFAGANDRAAQAARAAVNGAVDALRARLPAVAAQVRELLATQVRASQAQALQILTEAEPDLRARLNRIARDAAASGADGALGTARLQGVELVRAVAPYAIGVALIVAAAGGAYLYYQRRAPRGRAERGSAT